MSTLDEKGSSSKLFAAAMVLLAIGGIAAVVLLATNKDVQKQTDSVAVEGDVIAPLSGSVDTELGKVFPTVTGNDFDGNEITIEADGKPKAIIYLAHWCPHCQDEVPIVQDLINSGSKPENLEIYSVSTLVSQSPSNYPPDSWLEREGWTPPVILDDEDSNLFAQSGGTGTPYVVYLDGENKIIKRTSGQRGRGGTLDDWKEAAQNQAPEPAVTAATPAEGADTPADDSKTADETPTDGDTEADGETSGSDSTEKDSTEKDSTEKDDSAADEDEKVVSSTTAEAEETSTTETP